MRILVISDTHGDDRDIKRLLEVVRPDRVYHLGDSENECRFLTNVATCPVEMVCGNCDWYSKLPQEVVLEVGKHVLLITHGHRFSCKSSYDGLMKEAKRVGADYILYGHTHVPEIERLNGYTIINPGSLTYPRSYDRRGTYAVLNVDKNGEIEAAIRYVDMLPNK